MTWQSGGEEREETCFVFVNSPFHVPTPGDSTSTPRITTSNKETQLNWHPPHPQRGLTNSAKEHICPVVFTTIPINPCPLQLVCYRLTVSVQSVLAYIFWRHAFCLSESCEFIWLNRWFIDGVTGVHEAGSTHASVQRSIFNSHLSLLLMLPFGDLQIYVVWNVRGNISNNINLKKGTF